MHEALAQDFGEALGMDGGLRNALVKADPGALENAVEPHARGNVVVAAVFDALFSIYQRRTVDLFRIYRAGGARIQDVPEPLAHRLCDEVERITTRIFNMCWRAVDYCPAMHTTLGDFLRACITADFEYSPDDSWGLRDAMMQAFRLRGINSGTARFFSEDALRWSPFQGSLEPLEPANVSADTVEGFLKANAKALGLDAQARLEIYPVEKSLLTGPNDTPQAMWTTQMIVQPRLAASSTLVFDGHGHLKYVIPFSPLPRTARNS